MHKKNVFILYTYIDSLTKTASTANFNVFNLTIIPIQHSNQFDSSLYVPLKYIYIIKSKRPRTRL